MKFRFLMVLSLCVFSLSAKAADYSRDALDSLRDLQRGVRAGYLNSMPVEKQKQFMQQLSEATNTLFSSSNPPSIACIAQGNGWYAVVDLETNQKIGENVGNLNQCQEALPPLGSKYACIAQGNGWFAVYDMFKLQKLGENVGNFKQCQAALPKR